MLVEVLSGWCLNCTDVDHASICTILQNSVVIRLQGQFCQAEFLAPSFVALFHWWSLVFFAWKSPVFFGGLTWVLRKSGLSHSSGRNFPGVQSCLALPGVFRLKHWALLNSATGAAERPPGSRGSVRKKQWGAAPVSKERLQQSNLWFLILGLGMCFLDYKPGQLQWNDVKWVTWLTTWHMVIQNDCSVVRWIRP